MFGITKIDTIEAVALISFCDIPLDVPLLAGIFTGFSDAGINIDMISQTAPVGGKVSISFTCMESDMVKLLGLSKELQARYPGIRPMVSSGNTKIQLYGEEMRTTPGVFAKLLASLTGVDIEIRQITTSEVDISLLVSQAHEERTLTAVRAGFQIEA
jgi:aspartate kinase